MSSVLNLSTLFFKHWPWGQGWGLCYLRIVIGCAFVLHALGKFQFGWLTWLGTELPAWVQGSVAVIELLGGLGLVLGLLTPLATFSLAVIMLGTIVQFHLPRDHVFVALGEGQEAWELNATYLTTCLVLATQGAGAFAVDNLIKHWCGLSDHQKA
ncbi:MAG: DoxX family protein [Vampirovibrionales bacterium]